MWAQQGWMQVGSLSAIFPPQAVWSSGWEGAKDTSQAGNWVGTIWAFISSSSQENGDHTVCGEVSGHQTRLSMC